MITARASTTPAAAATPSSPFSEEGYFPQFTDYYYRASREAKHALDAYMRSTNTRPPTATCYARSVIVSVGAPFV